jgi:hypothetical protein
MKCGTVSWNSERHTFYILLIHTLIVNHSRQLFISEDHAPYPTRNLQSLMAPPCRLHDPDTFDHTLILLSLNASRASIHYISSSMTSKGHSFNQKETSNLCLLLWLAIQQLSGRYPFLATARTQSWPHHACSSDTGQSYGWLHSKMQH